MLETSARLLRLLGLLQAQLDWTGHDLADRLGVSTRTIRTDIERLRVLGYPVDARPGVAGGYRLGIGGSLPPLLLDDDEAVAVALGLQASAAGGVAGIEEISVRALAKLEQVLPSRLRHRVTMMKTATARVTAAGPTVAIEVLTAIAAAIRATELLRFDYTNHDGGDSRREVEPHRLVSWGRRWYLVAWDKDRDDWRTFRVDRVQPKVPTGPRFSPRELPDGDVATFVERGAGSATWQFRARVLLHAAAEDVRGKLPVAVDVVPAGAGRCYVEVGSDTPQMLALYIGLLDVDFEVIDAPEFAATLQALAARFQQASRSSPSGAAQPS